MDLGNERKFASKALVYVAQGINENVTIVIGYLLIDSINADQKAEIFVQLNQMTASRNAPFYVVTCDGDPTHISMAEKLGAKIRCNINEDLAKFQISNLLTTPGVDVKACFNLDVCHNNSKIAETH